MLQTLKEQKIGIITGVLSSAVFLYFIQPILDFLAHAFVKGSTYIGSTYTDRIYQQVAHLETQDYAFVLFMFLFGSQAAILIGLGIMGLRVASPASKAAKNSNNKKSQSKPNELRTLRVASSLMFIIAGFLLTTFIVSNFIQLSTISSFKQHLRVISPYISDQEEEEILSQWSLINSKEDYQIIYTRIADIAKTNNVSLPKNKIYSLLSI